MSITIAERSAPTAVAEPDQRLSFKTAATEVLTGGSTLSVDDDLGIVTAIVSVTGVVDEVDDIIVPGAYRKTLLDRNPKVCWAHSWEHPIGKVLRIEELMPGDKRLPATTRDGKAWPRAAGALVADMQFNLRTDEGKNAYEVVRFYSESGECEYSIGYNVPAGKASHDRQGTRHIKALDLYELSVVLFGAHTMTGTLSIKDARAVMTKRSTRGSIDVGALLGLKSADGHKPPQDVQDAAQRGLDLRKEHQRGGTGVGVARARDLARGATISMATLRRMASFFARHEGDKSADGWGSTSDPSAGYVAWLLWGGDPGKRWCESLVKRDEKKDRQSGDFAQCPRCGSNEVSHLDGPDQPRCADCGYHVALKAESKANPVPPQFQKDDGEGEGESGKPEQKKPTVSERDDLPDNDADTDWVTEDCPCGDLLVFDTGNGWQRLDGSYGHDDGTTHSDWLLPPETPSDEQGEDPSGEQGDEDNAPQEAPEATAGGDDNDGPPDHSDGIMVAVYPDPAAADAVASHISGPDDTTPREDLHVTLAYLGKIGEADVTEQWLIDAVTRAVEGQPPLSGEIGGLGTFPASDDGAPTWAPVDVAGLSMLREQVAAELGDAVYNDHGFTPHMTLGYDIGMIDPVPPTPVTFSEVRVVYGNSQRGIPLGEQVPERTDNGQPPPPMVKAYDPSIERLGEEIEALVSGKAGGADRNRGGAEDLRRYWTVGEGGAKIAWGTSGDFTRCVALLDEHMPGRAEGYCANRHKEMTGMWPGDRNNKDAGVETDVKGAKPPVERKSYPQMRGSYEERQQMVREAIESQYADDVNEYGHPTTWIDVRATWPDAVLYGVSQSTGIGNDSEWFMASYVETDGRIDFGEVEEVELTIVPVLERAADGAWDDVSEPMGDSLPIVESVMRAMSDLKTAARSSEVKAGRVLSGANERALRTAVQQLLAVMAAAGIEFGAEVSPDVARPTGNTGDGRGGASDVRHQVDPSIDMSTTSATASKDLRGGGESHSIDWTQHAAMLAEIREIAAD